MLTKAIDLRRHWFLINFLKQLTVDWSGPSFAIQRQLFLLDTWMTEFRIGRIRVVLQKGCILYV